MKQIFAKFLADESGATAIEYGLIAAGISITIILSTAGGQLPVRRMPRYALQPAISSATSTKSAGLVEC
jgi:pilus assembly protein Flp/PilA